MASVLSHAWYGSAGGGLAQKAMPPVQDLLDPQQIALFDALKQLCHLKVTSGIEVPQLIVVGDQSSGKSSVLEALGRFHFPVDDSLCTLFPTRLILRRSPEECITLWIEPGPSRSSSDRRRLSQFRTTLSSPGEFPRELKRVAIELGAISASSPGSSTGPQIGPRKFKDDILVVESSGPTLSHVDLIDLPGLWLNDSTEQDASSRHFVQGLVENYIKSKRSLVLLIISARANFHNQAGAKTIQRISQADPDLASRVVGVMTNPDQALSFKDSMSLLSGSVALSNLRHEWIVVKNQDQKERRNETLDHRDQREKNFFHTDPDWKAIPEGQWGIDSLKKVLRAEFLKHTQAYLPRLISEIEDKSDAIATRFRSSGPGRSTDGARRRYLYDIARKYEDLSLHTCLGTYQDVKCKEDHAVGKDCHICKRFFAPFGDIPPKGHVNNLRANIRALHRAFALAMRESGKTMEFSDNADERDQKIHSSGTTSNADEKSTTQTSESDPSTQSRRFVPNTDQRPFAITTTATISKYYTHPRPESMTRRDFDQWVADQIPAWSAREPQGEASDTVYHGLFEHQSKKWRAISENHLKAVWETVHAFVDAALVAACPDDDEVRRALRARYVQPSLDKLQKKSQRSLNDLLSCHARGNTGFYDGFVDIGPLRRRLNRISERLSKPVAEDLHTGRSGGHDLFEFVLDGAKKVAVVGGSGILMHDIVRDVLFRKVRGILSDAFELGGVDSDGQARSTEATHDVTFGLAPDELRGSSVTRVVENNEMFYEVGCTRTVPTAVANCAWNHRWP